MKEIDKIALLYLKDGHEKFASKEEMYATYSTYYNKTVDENTLVKIIKFELI